MLCETCNKREATVHFTKVVNNQKTEYHLCELCAREKGEELDFPLGLDPGFSIHNLLAGLLDMGGASPQSDKAVIRDDCCPKCGLSYAKFRQSGRLGCGDCYSAFADQLEPLLRRIQGTSSHSGKVPDRQGDTIKLQRKIGRLVEELKQVVDREEFELAAELRDQIKELRQQLGARQGDEDNG